MPMTSKEICKLLEKNGFTAMTQKGSHLKMVNKATGKQTIIPMHSKELGKGIEQAILKQAGLK